MVWSDLVIEQTMMCFIKSRGGVTFDRGMVESVRTVWVSTLHHCADVYQVLSTLVNNLCVSREHYVELGRSCIEKDF